jgi:hypothetical protein
MGRVTEIAGRIPADLEYRPELQSRRVEWTTWSLALVVGAAWFFLVLTGNPVPRPVPVLAILLSLFGSGVTLSNWMDRRTLLRLQPSGVFFTNGLRRSNIPWIEIEKIQVFPSPWGKKVRVIGQKAAFDFRTLGEVRLAGESKGRMGFTEGEKILHKLVEAAHLKNIQRTETGAVYYSRG